MGMGIKCGDKITVNIDGSDEKTAAAEIKKFFEQNM